MKRIQLILIVTMTFVLNACQSDDNNSEPMHTAEGIWRMQSLELGSVYDFNGDGIASNNLISETNCLQNEVYTFNNNGNGMYNSSETLDIELTVDSNSNETEYIIDCLNDDSFSEPLTWSQQGNLVTLIIDGEQLTGTINGDIMTFVFDQVYVVEVFDGTAIEEVEESVTLVLNRE
ncbi:hypothetical protein [uncultured Psychroserpens sp.]|uniref:hypothetical protein n=1 Tax=uncultured Psychroserpens sp. TaxID=255436 RepID=UPI00262D9195|nr:hypothetical protein [uncultured Psychroserpens sp.]